MWLGNTANSTYYTSCSVIECVLIELLLMCSYIHTMVASRVNISPVKPGSGMYVGDGMLQCILSLLML